MSIMSGIKLIDIKSLKSFKKPVILIVVNKRTDMRGVATGVYTLSDDPDEVGYPISDMPAEDVLIVEGALNVVGIEDGDPTMRYVVVVPKSAMENNDYVDLSKTDEGTMLLGEFSMLHWKYIPNYRPSDDVTDMVIKQYGYKVMEFFKAIKGVLMEYNLTQFITDLQVIKNATSNWGPSCFKGYDLGCVSLPNDLKLPMGRVMDHLNEAMITADGQTNYHVVELLEKIGIKHRTIERDSFGPLICAIIVNHGFIYYG